MDSNEIISYREMCNREEASLQHGMNFFPTRGHSVLLASLRPNAPYDDRLEEGGTVLVYEGHDESRGAGKPHPKTVDQPVRLPSGKLTANGLFFEAAQEHKSRGTAPRRVRVYEKIKDGIWSYNGLFLLVDSWTETSQQRRVCKFKLQATENLDDKAPLPPREYERRRVIPSAVKLAVWKRDGGRCVTCLSTTELHFDHVLPYSKGGTSDSVDNIQLLCMRHNLEKSARIV